VGATCRAGWRGSTGPRSLGSVADGSKTGWSAGGQGMQALHGGVDVACPGPGAVEANSDPAASADEPAGDGEQAQRQPFRFGDAVLSGQRQRLGPGEQVLGELDDLQPEAVGRIVLVGQVSHAGVFPAAAPVFAAGAAAVPAFQLASWPLPVLVTKQVMRLPPRSVTRSWAPGGAFPAGDDAQAGRPVREVHHLVSSATSAPSRWMPSPS